MASQYTHWMVCSTAGTSKHRLCKMFVILLPGTVALYNFSSSVCSDYMMIFCLAFGNDDGKYSNFIGTLDQTGGNVSLSRKGVFRTNETFAVCNILCSRYFCIFRKFDQYHLLCYWSRHRHQTPPTFNPTFFKWLLLSTVLS